MREWHFDELDERHPCGPPPRPEAIKHRQGPQPVIVCLSGGGQRAAAYHLGALRRMWELGVLEHVDELRAVSGGSCTAAWLATVLGSAGNWRNVNWDEEVAHPFRRFLTRDLRSKPILLTTGLNFLSKEPRLRLFERALRNTLPLADDLNGLERPRICLLATDLIAGEVVELPNPSWRKASTLPRAVIASAAFPPFIGPMRVRNGGQVRQLSDGGLLGNLGLAGETILRSGVVLVSDASFPPTSAHAGYMPRTWLFRALRVAGRRADQVMRHQLWMLDSDDHRLQIWAINRTSHRPSDDYPNFEYPQALVDCIASVPTDLAGLAPEAQQVIENHGYLRAATNLSWLGLRIRRTGTGSEQSEFERQLAKVGPRPEVRPPFPEMCDPDRCADALGARGVARLHQAWRRSR